MVATSEANPNPIFLVEPEFGLVGPQGPGQECHRGKTAKTNMLTKLEMFGSLGEKE